MYRLAYALEMKNPFAYLFIFLLFEPPVMFLLCFLVEWIVKKIKEERRKKSNA